MQHVHYVAQRITGAPSLDRTVAKNRLLGFTKFIAGAAGFALVFWYVMHHGAEPQSGTRLSGYMAVAAGVPGAIALIGLFETATGRSFRQASDYWDNLKAWQRAVFGTLVVLLALIVVSAVFLLLAWTGTI